jgi:hypothetical protein
VLIGGTIYAGLGAGLIRAEETSDPFLLLRAGLDLEALPGLHLDINASYFSATWEDIGDVREDIESITFGAVVRFALR